jgi:hypothetical protein
LALLGCVLFVRAALTFVYDYKTTEGASCESIINGQCVSTYWSSHITRTITEREYRTFPNLWTRVMSVGMGMMAVFILTQFTGMNGPGNSSAVGGTRR